VFFLCVYRYVRPYCVCLCVYVPVGFLVVCVCVCVCSLYVSGLSLGLSWFNSIFRRYSPSLFFPAILGRHTKRGEPGSSSLYLAMGSSSSSSSSTSSAFQWKTHWRPLCGALKNARVCLGLFHYANVTHDALRPHVLLTQQPNIVGLTGSHATILYRGRLVSCCVRIVYIPYVLAALVNYWGNIVQAACLLSVTNY